LAFRNDGEGEVRVVGVDGCRTGWFAVAFDGKRWVTAVYKSVRDLWIENSNADLILIDTPIGLRENVSDERLCDIEARKLLGRPRSSSVFPAPCRAAVYENICEDASRINKELTGRGLPLQSYYIIRKIREVDTLLTEDPAARRVIRETHPEVCFWAFAGGSMKHPKKSRAGFRARLELLEFICPGAGRFVKEASSSHRRRDVGRDDIVDALAAAVAAVGDADGLASVPDEPEYDSVGLPMEIVYATYGKDAECPVYL
jgi:predicted RNase H-like nuclease